jgi:hypothetical protein
MLAITPDLTAAQASPRRKPAISFTAQQSRFGIPLPFLSAREDTSSDADCQLSLAYDPSQEAELLAVRTNGTALESQQRYPTIGSWTSRDTVTAGQGFQLAWDTGNGEYALAYGDGLSVKLLTSPDGQVWNSSVTIVTEASNIGAVALAFDDAGDACLFYAIGTSSTLKRLRRTSGTWAGAGTTWSRSADVANLTGAAAQWQGDYVLALTGIAAATLHPRLWAVKMGDQVFPANVWSSLKGAVEADAASGLTFAYPSLTIVDDVFFASFQRTEAGDVANSRPYLVHAMPTAGPLGWWSEPRPVPADNPAANTHGAALAFYPRGADTHSTLFVAPARDAWEARFYSGTDLSSRLLAATYRLTPDALKVRLELDNTDGTARDGGPISPPLYPGMDLELAFGYRIADGSAEYGQTLRCNVHRLIDQIAPGKHRLIVEASGPWEAMDRYRTLSTWTAPASTTRGQVFARIAALAGIEVSEAGGSRAPSTAWSTDAPAFAIAANERGSTTLQRLLAVTPDFLRPAFGAGGFEICGSLTDTSVMQAYCLGRGIGNELPLLEAEQTDELAPNWVRLQGPDRYADSFFEFSDNYDDVFSRGPIAQLVRDQDTDDDDKAENRSIAARQRAAQLQPRGRAVTTANVAHELFDVVSVRWNLNPADGLESASYRLIGLGLDYRASPTATTPAYTTTLELGSRSAFS